jgi:hypothetical protein
MREHAWMDQPPGRRLTQAHKQRLRDACIEFVMSRSVDPFALKGMPGEQSWYVTVTEPGAAGEFASLAVHRVPLGGGDELALQADAGDTIPGSPVSVVVDGDALLPEVEALLPEGAWGESFLVVEPIDLDVEWQGLGVGELLVGVALAELQNSDVLVVVEPVPWFLKGRARTAPAALQRPIFENLGFRPFQGGAWLLTDWALLHQALERCKQRFDFELPMNERDD